MNYIKRENFKDTTLNYRNKLLDKQKKKYKSKFLEIRKCPVCSSSKNRKILDVIASSFACICNNCKMVYLNLVFKDKYLFDYYSKSPDVQANAHEKEKKFYKSIYGSGLEIINKKKKVSC